jgi:hypothetical protein
MSKIPVGATIAHAYRFAFGSFVDIFLCTWAAAVLQAALSILLMRQMGTLMQGLLARDPSVVTQFAPLLLLYPLAFFLLFVQVTAVMELALGQLPGRRLFHFPAGRPVWRMIGAFLFALVAILVLIIGGMLAVAAVGFLLRTALGGLAPGMARGIIAICVVLAFLAGYCGLIYALVRLTFLIPPVTIARKRIDLVTGWKLTRRNFWRIFLVLLAILLPFFIVEYAALFAAGGMPPLLPKNMSADAQQAFQQAKMAWQLGLITRLSAAWYITVPVTMVLTMLLLGLFSGAQAFAWRALSGSAPVARDGLPD